MPDALEIAAELRGFAEGSSSTRASLMRDAAEAIERLAGLNDVFLDMRDRVGDYSSAPPAARFFGRGEAAFEWAATSVRRAVTGEPTLVPPVPLYPLRADDPQSDRWKHHVLTCGECGERFSAGARVEVEHRVYPDMPSNVYHYGRVPVQTDGAQL